MKFNNGDKVRIMDVDNAFAKFMNLSVGDEFIVENIDDEHGAHLVSVEENKRLVFSANLIDKYFEKVEDEAFYDIDDDEFGYIAEILSESKFNVTSVFGKCTIVACQLPNGFVIVESSSCVDPENYDEEIGIENCMNRIKDKVIELEAYIRHNIENVLDDDDEDTYNPCPYEDCDNCPCGECTC